MAYRQVRPPRRRPKRPVRRIVRDPLAPLSPQQLQEQTGGLVNAQMGPLIAQANTAASNRASQGSQAITNYTSALAGHLGEYADRAKAAFGEAEQQTAASSEALRNALTGAGTQQSAELAGKLSSFGAPAAAQTEVAGGAQRDATGAANAGYATGTNDLQSLVAQGANQQGYSNALPGIVALQGLQNIKELQAQTSQQLSEKIAELSANGQQMYLSLFNNALDRELQKALARQSGQFKNAQAEADAYYKAQTLAFKKADMAWKRSKAQADRAEKAREANQRARTAGKNARTAAQRAAEQRRANRARERQQRQNERGRNKRSKKKKGKDGGSGL